MQLGANPIRMGGGREGGMPFQLERFPIGRGIMEHQFHVF